MKASGRIVLVIALSLTLAAASDAWARGRGGHAGRPGVGAARPGTGAMHPGQRPTGHPGHGPTSHGPGQHPDWRAGATPGHGWQPGQPGWRSDLNPANARSGQWRNQANQIRSNVQTRYNNLFTPQWYRDHPNAWRLTHPHADAWAVASAAAMAAWIGAANSPAGYGDTVVYEGDTVYINGEEVSSVEEYTDQASQLANQVATTTANQKNWLPVGVFALAGNGQTSGDRVLQLALAQDGTVGGTYYDSLTDQDLPVKGSVDRATGRVAWTIGTNDQTVMETQLDNLAKDQTPVQVHLGKNNTQNWLMVRLGNPQQTTTGQQQ